MSLTGPTRTAASGTADSLVILLHGYGADGSDLMGLADPLAPHLPTTMFTAPNAPEACANNPMGYQWFPIPHMDGASEEQMRASMLTSVALLNQFLDDMATKTGIPPERTLLLGFSQGTMMSLHVAPRRAAAVAGVIGFSGRLLLPETLGKETLSRPPVLLIHGDQDPVVPLQSMPDAQEALTEAGFDVATHVSRGTAHGIAPDGLSLAAHFMIEHLP